MQKPDNWKRLIGTTSLEKTKDVYERYLLHKPKTVTEKNEASDGKFGVFINPRVGVKLFSGGGVDWTLYAGYRWDFAEFNFNKDHTSDYFTIGIAGLF